MAGRVSQSFLSTGLSEESSRGRLLPSPFVFPIRRLEGAALQPERVDSTSGN